jgi:hypothetical protein
VADEQVLGPEPAQARRAQAQEGVDAHGLAPGPEERCGAERVGADEHAALRPPERDLLPEAVPAHG